jgi:hypothetical protein
MIAHQFPLFAVDVPSDLRRFGSGGSGKQRSDALRLRIRKVSEQERVDNRKMAVLAPMESASVTATVPEKAGLRLSWRTANSTDCIIVPDVSTGMPGRGYHDPEKINKENESTKAAPASTATPEREHLPWPQASYCPVRD